MNLGRLSHINLQFFYVLREQQQLSAVERILDPKYMFSPTVRMVVQICGRREDSDEDSCYFIDIDSFCLNEINAVGGASMMCFLSKMANE